MKLKFRNRSTKGALIAVAFGLLNLYPTTSSAQLPENGEYEITSHAGKTLNIEDKMFGRRISGGTPWRFILKSLGGGVYHIEVKTNDGNIPLHANDNFDKKVSIRYTPGPEDEFTQFKLIPVAGAPGMFHVQTKASGRYWQVSESGDRVVNTVQAPAGKSSQFKFEKIEAVDLFSTSYTAPVGKLSSKWVVLPEAYNPIRKETQVLRVRNDPVKVELKQIGTPEVRDFGTTVTLLGKKAPAGRLTSEATTAVILEDVDRADGSLPVQVSMGQVGSVHRKNGEITVLLQDVSRFFNEDFESRDFSVGPFLDTLMISYGEPSDPEWGAPRFSPLAQNKDGQYTQSTTIGVDISAGFDGKTPGGSIGASLSHTSSSGTSIPDMVFSQRTKNRNPIFTWRMGNCYEDTTGVHAYKNDVFNMLKLDGVFNNQASGVIRQPAELAKGTFEVATSCAYTHRKDWAPGDFKVTIHYAVGYRTIVTKPRLLEPIAAIANAWVSSYPGIQFDPKTFEKTAQGMSIGNLLTGKAFAEWESILVIHQFPVEVTIPAAVINGAGTTPAAMPRPRATTSGAIYQGR